jgi:hypothetical protein
LDSDEANNNRQTEVYQIFKLTSQEGASFTKRKKTDEIHIKNEEEK